MTTNDRIWRMVEWHAQNYAEKYGWQMAAVDRIYSEVDARLVPLELKYGLYDKRQFIVGVKHA